MSLSEATEVVGKEPWRLEEPRAQRGKQGSVHQECKPNTVRTPLALSGHQQFPGPRKRQGLLTITQEDGDCGLGWVKEALSSQALAIFPPGGS